MTNLTAKGIKNYLEENYGVCKHNEIAMKEACVIVAKELKTAPLNVFFYIVERRPIQGLGLISYGFDSAEGREVREVFQSNYYEILEEINEAA